MWRAWLLLPVLLWSTPAWSAITCTGQAFPFDAPTNPQNQAYTVPTVTNGITFIHPGTRNAAREVTAITIGGLTPTAIETVVQTANTSNEAYYRLNVPAGSQSINITWDGRPLSYVLTVLTCENVDQGTPIRDTTSTQGSGTAVSVTCDSTAADQVLGFVTAGGNSGAFTAAGHTILSQGNADATLVSGDTTKAGSSTSTTMTATLGTSADWSSMCASLIEAASPAGFGPLRLRAR